MSKFAETTIDAVKDRALPKWPQVFLTGKDVSKEQALDILFRTDQFINSLGVLGGNDREWETRAARRMGVPTRKEQYDNLEKAKLSYKMMDAWGNRDGAVKTEYVNNAWISTAYIGGPSGWCSPQGKIYHDKNVGKWPSVECVYNDLVKISEAFPYLEAAATVMNGEWCEDNKQAVVSFLIANGGVKVVDTEGDDWKDLHHHEMKNEGFDEMLKFIASGSPRNREHGLGWEDCATMFDKVKQWLEANPVS